MDEYVGNDWPGYTRPMPKHGHRWIDILQKERGQVPMIDIAYVPTMQRALMEVVLLGGLGGVVGVHVLLRRLAFLTASPPFDMHGALSQ